MQIDPNTDRAMINCARMARLDRPRGAWAPLLSAVLGIAGGKAELLRHGEKAWASATFAGARHTIALAFDGAEAVAAGEAFIAALPDHEFTLPRHLVADAAITAVEHTMDGAPKLVVEAEFLLLNED